MAPVYDFRHVELDKIGRGKRVVKPPGGEASDIFGVRCPQDSSPQQTPRKVKNYQQSSIFTPPQDSSPTTPTRRRLSDNSRERLFGTDEGATPRRVVDRMKSSVFAHHDATSNGKSTDGYSSNGSSSPLDSPPNGRIH